MNIFSDSKYVDDVKRGNTAAFEPLVRKYQDRIYSFIIRIVRSEEDAKDVVQEVFLKAFRSLHSFKGEAKFSTWLFQIAYNTAISLQRKQQKSLLLERNLGKEITYYGYSPDQNNMESEERKLLVNQAIDKLSSSDAAIVNLYYKEELPVAEIAGIMQMSESNVKVKLHRSRKKLFEQLEKVLIL